jgi:hypothetical protein
MAEASRRVTRLADKIPRERIVAIIERELPRFNTSDDGIHTGLHAMATEISLTTGCDPTIFSRRLRAILTGDGGVRKRTGRRLRYDNVTFETADAILTGLGLTHLWFTELADVYEPAQRQARKAAA